MSSPEMGSERKRMSDRIERNGKSYLGWQCAGGPNECAHGYAAGIPCPDCDASKLPSSPAGETGKEPACSWCFKRLRDCKCMETGSGNYTVPDPLGDISGPKGSGGAAKFIDTPYHAERLKFERWYAANRMGLYMHLDERLRMAIEDTARAAWFSGMESTPESAAPIAPAAQDELVELVTRARKLMGSFLSVDDQVQTYAIHAPNWLQDLVKWYEDTACPICDGSGAVDSGGSQPWGAPIDIKCGACDGTGLKQFVRAERKEGEAK